MAIAKHAIPSELKIAFEFDIVNSDNGKRFYHVFCRTYDKGELTQEHRVADALYESGTGLFVFPVGSNIHKSVRDAYAKQNSIELNTKAKWTEEGFLFKERK